MDDAPRANVPLFAPPSGDGLVGGAVVAGIAIPVAVLSRRDELERPAAHVRDLGREEELAASAVGGDLHGVAAPHAQVWKEVAPQRPGDRRADRVGVAAGAGESRHGERRPAEDQKGESAAHD
jgi:hypothetical protein